MKDADELDMHLAHTLAYQRDPDLWEEEMRNDAQRYLAECGNDEK